MDHPDTEPNMTLTALKPVHAQWIINAWKSLKEKPATFIRGWEKSGIKNALETIDILIN